MKTTKTKYAHGAAGQVKVCMTAQLAATVMGQALSLLKKKWMTAMTSTNWPFNFPPVPWTEKQIKEYAQQQRAQLPESPL
jgi:hypothetical protein